VLLISADTIEDLEGQATDMLTLAEEWATMHKLEFSSAKSQALTLKGKLQQLPVLRLCGDPIEFQQVVKYLGVTIQQNGRYNSHIREAAAKLWSYSVSLCQ